MSSAGVLRVGVIWPLFGVFACHGWLRRICLYWGGKAGTHNRYMGACDIACTGEVVAFLTLPSAVQGPLARPPVTPGSQRRLATSEPLGRTGLHGRRVV